jgi:hypothetical protein
MANNWFYSLSEATSDKPFVSIMNPYMVVPNGAVLPATDAPDWCGKGHQYADPSPNLNLGNRGSIEGVWRENQRLQTTVAASQYYTLTGSSNQVYFPN